MTWTWSEAVFAFNEKIVACERRFHRQCIFVADLAAHKEVTAQDESLLASYWTSLVLLRAHRDALLEDARSSA